VNLRRFQKADQFPKFLANSRGSSSAGYTFGTMKHLRTKPYDRTSLPKTVVFVTDRSSTETTENSCATNPWQNLRWFCHAFAATTNSRHSRSSQHSV